MISRELDAEIYENPVTTFPIKKRISTELFIERRTELYL